MMNVLIFPSNSLIKVSRLWTKMDFDKRGGWNKRGGWKIFDKSINVEGGFLRGGWIFFQNH